MKRLIGLGYHQLMFINSYVEHRDAQRAVKESGWLDGRDAAQEQILQQAHEWLSDDTVSDEIERRMIVMATASSVTQAEIVDELRKIAFFNFKDLYNENGELRQVHELDDETAHALMQYDVITVAEGGMIMKASPASKLKALELLGKHRKMFVDTVEHVGKGQAGIVFGWELPAGTDTSGLDSFEPDGGGADDAE